MEVIILALLITLIIFRVKNKKLKKEIETHKQSVKGCFDEFTQYKNDTEYLRKYEHIKNVEEEKERIESEADKILRNAQQNSDIIIKEANKEKSSIQAQAREKAKDVVEKAEIKINEAFETANKIEIDAQIKAKEIAGEAWEAKQNADQYEATVKAMKNIIKGYGDEYLIPNHSLLDELAEEYEHAEAGTELAKTRNLIKLMIKNQEAADCDYAESSRRQIAIEFVLDAFNGKVDSIMSKVKHDNYGKLLQSLKDAFRLVNHNGKPFRNARIEKKYFDVILEQLKLAVTIHELKLRDREEQKAIREEMREEERARREYEKAKKEAEKEERMLAKAMKDAEAKLAGAAKEEREKFEQELELIKQQLLEAEEKGQRAMSMAQQTKRGHVYIISNVGSFGEETLKIGLTRRLEPMDRIKELGDASVPFQFDVHAMIHSENAPQLEKELHKVFENMRVNKVNYRKEFFKVPIGSVREKIEKLGLETKWTMKADALEYRESIQLEKEGLVFSEN